MFESVAVLIADCPACFEERLVAVEVVATFGAASKKQQQTY